MNVQHESRSDSWRTPPHILEMVRIVLGDPITLDPASSEAANAHVAATHYYTKADNGLALPWHGSVYCNPPGGKTGNKSNVRLFWRKLIEERNNIAHAIFAMFSIEGLQTTQGDYPSAMHFPFCVPAKRVRWWLPGRDAQSPSHSNAFVYVPGNIDKTERFVTVFSALGKVKR